jgi:hypothetical protein
VVEVLGLAVLRHARNLVHPCVQTL